MVNTKSYFSECRTKEAAKKLWKDLMKKHHPDHGGDTETAKAINAEFDAFMADQMFHTFHQYQTDTGRTARGTYTVFGDMLAKAMRLNVRVEIIGYWIYAFESKEYRETLKSWGFWFSGKHKAWVYSGTRKRNVRTRYTTNEIRGMHGYTVEREKED